MNAYISLSPSLMLERRTPLLPNDRFCRYYACAAPLPSMQFYLKVTSFSTARALADANLAPPDTPRYFDTRDFGHDLPAIPIF